MELHYQTIIPNVNIVPVFIYQSGITNDYIILSLRNQLQLITTEKWIIQKYLREELGFNHNEINFDSSLISLLNDYARYYQFHRHLDL